MLKELQVTVQVPLPSHKHGLASQSWHNEWIQIVVCWSITSQGLAVCASHICKICDLSRIALQHLFLCTWDSWWNESYPVHGWYVANVPLLSTACCVRISWYRASSLSGILLLTQSTSIVWRTTREKGIEPLAVYTPLHIKHNPAIDSQKNSMLWNAIFFKWPERTGSQAGEENLLSNNSLSMQKKISTSMCVCRYLLSSLVPSSLRKICRVKNSSLFHSLLTNLSG